MTADVVSGQSVFVLDKDQNLEDVHTRCLPPSRLVIYTSRSDFYLQKFLSIPMAERFELLSAE